MPGFKYLIVGGGMAADAAVEGIRDVDPTGSIGLIGEEPDAPYNRPPLSKGLWKGASVDEVFRHTAEHGATLLLGRRVRRLDLDRRVAIDDQGQEHGFERLLLATGGRPRRLPFGGDDVLYYRTLADFRRLWDMAKQAPRFAVIGGGFIGAEVAAALAMNGKQVSLLFPEPTIGARVFPAELGRFLGEYYGQHGVRVRPGTTVTGIVRGNGSLRVQTSGGEVEVDGVVAGIGIQPDVELAEAAGLAVEDGIVVDEYLRTTRPEVYAAGDVAAFTSPVLEKRLRFEHEDNALSMGRHAGRNMAGANAVYEHLPFFYSDLFDLGYEAVGEVDARLGTVADWKVPNREGVIYYHSENRVRGVLLWNTWDKVEAARRLIAARQPAAPGALRGLLTANV